MIQSRHGILHHGQQLLTDADARTFQRAVFGQYPPGSTFKPITALSALKKTSLSQENIPVQKAIEMRAVDRCDAGFTHKEAPGSIDMQEALMYSCNIYFYEIAQEMGYASLYETARAFGMGQYAGLFPDLEAPPEHQEMRYGNLPETAANPTDLCNLSIGQENYSRVLNRWRWWHGYCKWRHPLSPSTGKTI